MWFLSKEGLETSAKIVGLVVGASTLARALVVWTLNQSLERRISKTTERIGESIRSMQELEESKAHVEAIDVHVYATQLRESLQADLEWLEPAREKKRRREENRKAVPKGAQTWFLFFRPLSFDGWLVHSLFYLWAFLLAVTAHAALRDGQAFSKDFLSLAVGYFVILLYLRRTALRLKAVAILRQAGHLDSINGDLGLFRRTFLLFKPTTDWTLVLQIEYYMFVAGGLAIPILFQRAGGLGSTSKPFFWEVSLILMSVFLLGARVLAADALARRFLGIVLNTETSPPDAASIDSPS